jgi:WD40 repeat protein
VAIAGADGTIRVRETETGHVCAVLPGGDGRVRALAFSPDERFLASAGDDAWVRLWDVGTSDRRADLQEHDRPVHALAFSPDSEFLVSGGDDGRVCLWETMGGTPVWARPGHPDRVRAVAFSPDGSRIACGGADRSIQVWDAATGGHLATLTSHTDWVRALVFLSGGQLLASAGDDHSVRLWDLGEPLTPDADGATGLRTQASKAEVSLAEAARVAPGPHAITHSTVLGTHDDRVWSLACAPDGTTLASGAEDGTIALWDVPQRARTATVRADRPYERLNITSATGLTAGQRSALKSLGAYEDE